ncbi:MAG: adenylate kinase family protein [Candidatus Methylacidiphilales bacterium]
MQYRTFLIFGAPGSGKGTQGQILGSIPGFCHLACGDVFRNLDASSELGRAFLGYSSRGDLVPDSITIQLWREHMQKMRMLGRFKPEIDHLILDGIPRNHHQAEMLQDDLLVKKVFYLTVPDQEILVDRMKRRALKDNRLDDANETTIRERLRVYDEQSKSVLDFYGPERCVKLDAMLYPYEVLREILSEIDTRS